jgi:hypothetical protein
VLDDRSDLVLARGRECRRQCRATRPSPTAPSWQCPPAGSRPRALASVSTSPNPSSVSRRHLQAVSTASQILRHRGHAVLDVLRRGPRQRRSRGTAASARAAGSHDAHHVVGDPCPRWPGFTWEADALAVQAADTARISVGRPTVAN